MPVRLVTPGCLLAAFCLLSAAANHQTRGDEPAGTTFPADKLPVPLDKPVDFARDVQPIFAEHCLQCHGADAQESGLRLDLKERALAGGDSGLAFAPEKSAESPLVHRISGLDPEIVMPPDSKGLPAEQVAILRAWIDQGANWPDASDEGGATKTDHWAYQPIVRPEVPQPADAAWVRNPIDAFVLARLETAGIKPSPDADRYTLIRRLSIDLLGLPPSIDDVHAFVADESPEAYEKLVDRLLESPHFGERWGRHWLDIARYADSDGYEKDNPRHDAWKWRDWVIQAINDDMPFDEFTIEQLAGDLLPDATGAQKLATAFNRQTLTNTEGGTDKEEFRVEAVADRVETLGTGWLGLTIGCARCHTHKYDQITQREFYQLFAFFNNGDETSFPLPISDEAVAKYQVAKAEYDRQLAELDARIAVAGPAAQAETEKLKTEKTELEKKAPPPPTIDVRVISQRTESPRATHLLKRGDFLQPADRVEPGTLAVLPRLAARTASAPPDRLDLARWLASRENPLTPRVCVNHVWQHLFGQGLVKTTNDFGVRGEAASHPDLLDWLADEWFELGLSRKALVKLIVMSATYRQSSAHRSELKEIDANNRLLARQNRFRVEAEIVRDLSLAAGGLMSRKVGGPSVYPPMPADVAALSYANNFKWTASEGEDRHRRGMYTFFKRTAPHPNLTAFDCPDSNKTCVERASSNTPLQALTTLNNIVFSESAQGLARRALGESGLDDSARIRRAFEYSVARSPGEAETAAFLELLAAARDYYGKSADEAKAAAGATVPEGVPVAEAAAWAATARILLNLDEFITRE